jgi:acyl carrier protein
MSKIAQSDVIVVIENALDIQPGTLTSSTCAEEVESWDSIGQLSILVALDELYDGKIANISDMAEADSIAKIIEILRQHKML